MCLLACFRARVCSTLATASASCPDEYSGGHPDRQMIVSTALMVQLPEGVQAEITVHDGAKRCSYCGLVYLSPMVRCKAFSRWPGQLERALSDPPACSFRVLSGQAMLQLGPRSEATMDGLSRSNCQARYH